MQVFFSLAKLNRENVSTDDLKTLLSTLGFDDDRQVRFFLLLPLYPPQTVFLLLLTETQLHDHH